MFRGCIRTHRSSPPIAPRGCDALVGRSPSSGGRRRPRGDPARVRAPARAREPDRSRARPAAGARAGPTSPRRPAAGRARRGQLRAPPRPHATRRTSNGGPRPERVPGMRTPPAPTRSASEGSRRIDRRWWARVVRSDRTRAAPAGRAPRDTPGRTATGLRRIRRKPVGTRCRSLDRAPFLASRHATPRRRQRFRATGPRSVRPRP